MKKFSSLLIALVLLGAGSTAFAATLIEGSQINHIWKMVSGIGLRIVKDSTGAPGNAFQVVTPTGGRNIFTLSSSGAIGLGHPVNFGTAGDCLKSGGGSGSKMTFGTCGAGGTTNTGGILDAGNSRFVNVSGDTMTGALLIKKASGTATGNTLVVDTKGLVYDATNKRVGIGTATPKTALDVIGTISGSALTVSSLSSCTNLQTSSAGALSCNNTAYQTETLSDARYVNVSGDTMTGALNINLASGTLGLNVRQTMSGQSLFVTGNTTLSSGALIRTSAAANRGLIIRNAASQTGNSFEVQTSAGTPYFTIFGKPSLNANGDSVIYANPTYSMGAGITTYGMNFEPQLGAGTSAVGTHSTAVFSPRITAASNAPSLVQAFQAYPVITGGQTTNSIQSVQMQSAFIGAGSRANTLTDLKINDAFLSSGTVGTHYGLLIDDLIVATTDNFAISTGLGKVKFGDSLTVKKLSGTSTGNTLIVDTNGLVFDATNKRVGIGTATPKAKLDVVGTISGSSIVSQTAVSPANVTIQVFASGSSLGTGTGKAIFTIPRSMSGFNLTDAHARFDTAGTTNTTDIDVKNKTKNRNFFSTALNVDSTETGSDTAATPFVINTANDDVGGFDQIQINIPRISTTAPKGLIVTLTFRRP